MIAATMLVAIQLAAAQVEELDPPPETPPMPPPPALAVAPDKPAPLAPDARDLLTSCPQPVFTDCFRLWRPPVPPPPSDEEGATPDGALSAKPGDGKTDAAKGETPPSDTSGGAEKPPAPPKKRSAGTPASAPPPEPPKPKGPPGVNPADQATYDALVKAIKDVGLTDQIIVPGDSQPGEDASVGLSSPKALAPASAGENKTKPPRKPKKPQKP